MTKKELLKKSKYLIKKSKNIIFVKADGLYLYDINGDKYLDVTATAWTMGLGYNNKRVNDKAIKQIKELCHCRTHYYTISKLLLAEKISKLSPIKNGRVDFCLHGSNANEEALKLAFNKRGPGAVCYLEDGFHGRTFGTMSISWKHQNKKFIDYYGKNIEVKKDIKDVIYKIKKYKPVAFIIELIQGNGGQYVLDYKLVKTIERECKKNNVVFIVDEIQTGFGRCGCMFLSEKYHIHPDIITFGKGVGGGLPLFGCICAEGFNLEKDDHSFTFSHFPVSMSSSLEYISLVSKGLLKSTLRKGEYVKKRLKEIGKKTGHLGNERGIGFMLGVDVLDDKGNPSIKLAELIVEKMFEKKIIMNLSKAEGYGFTLKFKPALTISKFEIDYVLDNLEKVLLEI